MTRMTADLSIQSTALTTPKAREKLDDVCLLIDSSGSMATMMENGKIRIHNLVDSLIALMNVSSPNRTSYTVVSFNDHPSVLALKTTDYLDIQCIRPIPDGGTSMHTGISRAVQCTPKRIVLMSDGYPTCPLTALWNAVEGAVILGIPIDTIAFCEASTGILEEIARRTGGVYQKAEDADQLTRAYLALETSVRHLLIEQRP